MALVDSLREVVFIDDSGTVEEPVLLRTCACDWQQCTITAHGDTVLHQPQQRHFKEITDSDLPLSTLCCHHAPRLCLPTGTHLHCEVVEVSVPGVHEYYTRKAAQILARNLQSSARHVDLFVHLGVHGGARAVHVEEFAYNLADFRVPDERQLQPRNMPICGAHVAAGEPCASERAVVPAYLPALSLALTNTLAHSFAANTAIDTAMTVTCAGEGDSGTRAIDDGVADGVEVEVEVEVARAVGNPDTRVPTHAQPARSAQPGQSRAESLRALLQAVARAVETSGLHTGAALHTGLRVRAVLRGEGVRVGEGEGEGEGGCVGSPLPLSLPLSACVGATPTNDPGAFLCNYAFFLALHWTRVAAPRLEPLVARARQLLAREAGEEAEAREEAEAGEAAYVDAPVCAAAALPTSPPHQRGTGLFVHVPPFAVVPAHAQLHTVVRVLAACVADVRTQGLSTRAAPAAAAEAEAECKRQCPAPLAGDDALMASACGADDGACGVCACTWLCTRRRAWVDTSDVVPHSHSSSRVSLRGERREA